MFWDRYFAEPVRPIIRYTMFCLNEDETKGLSLAGLLIKFVTFYPDANSHDNKILDRWLWTDCSARRSHDIDFFFRSCLTHLTWWCQWLDPMDDWTYDANPFSFLSRSIVYIVNIFRHWWPTDCYNIGRRFSSCKLVQFCFPVRFSTPSIFPFFESLISANALSHVSLCRNHQLWSVQFMTCVSSLDMTTLYPKWCLWIKILLKTFLGNYFAIFVFGTVHPPDNKLI